MLFIESEDSIFEFSSGSSVTAHRMPEVTSNGRVFMRLIEWPGDSVGALDFLARTVEVLDQELRPGRSVPIGFRPFDAVVSGGRLVASASLNTPDLAGFALHYLDLSGNGGRTDSFDEVAYFRRDEIDMLDRRLVGGDGGFWTADRDEPRIRFWRPGEERPSLTLLILTSFDWDAEVGGDSARMVDVAYGADGRVWTIMHVPDPDWLGSRTVDYLFGGQRQRLLSNNDRWDSIVHVVDPGTGEINGIRSFDVALLGWVDGERSAFAYESIDGAIGASTAVIYEIQESSC
jgi:hypothetical protein